MRGRSILVKHKDNFVALIFWEMWCLAAEMEGFFATEFDWRLLEELEFFFIFLLFK